MVPTATTSRVPSTICATELWPEKPRADRLVPPLPGDGASLMPGMRTAASWARTSTRSAMSALLMLLTLAGVSRAVKPRREPVPFSSSRPRPLLAVRRLSPTSTAGRVGWWARAAAHKVMLAAARVKCFLRGW